MHMTTLVCVVGLLVIEVTLVSGYVIVGEGVERFSSRYLQRFVGALLMAVSVVLWISFLSLLWFAFTTYLSGTPYYGD